MGKDIQKTLSPEEEELLKKQEKLTALEDELAQSELDLATLQIELGIFESKYNKVIGVKYAELDRIEAQIATLLAKKNPHDDVLNNQAKEAQEKYNETARTVGDIKDEKISDKFKPSESLKNLYRNIARKIHPDLATDPEDRERRNRIMAEVNKAYKEGNEERLLEILREWETSPESVTGEGSGAQLVKIIRKIARIKTRLQKISVEIKALQTSELFILKIKVEEALKIGNDLLEELARDIEDKISIAKKRLLILLQNE